MNKKTIQVQLAGATLTVPIYENEQTTREIVDQVNARLKEIEAHSPRVDTQAFALQAAASFAAELAQARKENASDTREILLTLNRIHEDLRSVLDELEVGE